MGKIYERLLEELYYLALIRYDRAWEKQKFEDSRQGYYQGEKDAYRRIYVHMASDDFESVMEAIRDKVHAERDFAACLIDTRTGFPAAGYKNVLRRLLQILMRSIPLEDEDGKALLVAVERVVRETLDS